VHRSAVEDLLSAPVAQAAVDDRVAGAWGRRRWRRSGDRAEPEHWPAVEHLLSAPVAQAAVDDRVAGA